ncbi:zinc finger protein [Kwoniella mangroviensis CBS 10435]|uniref:Zinc finger protein n=1 Tax=Kwoniella mangroviensis CBS 10435 TaxID=1331196 RepID=A0A1B9IN30_9TREE|nr:zinc finger protein [Kwoniella mangroviensis CBS 8507]OCF57008.1 zinc finger protein [Kwoniella mangroviensis CBS 10435]OCF67443.1 zinc finger protein [Kwoniella mangroviensis CBS 8507]
MLKDLLVHFQALGNILKTQGEIKNSWSQSHHTSQKRFSFSLIMCKHILNAQVAIRAPCCKKFFDCPQCHEESQDHPLRKTMEMAFMCKKCKKAFRKDMTTYEESDEYCPHCDNHYVIEAKEPQAMIGVEGEDARIDARMIKDDRVREDPQRSLFAQKDVSDKIDTPLWQLPGRT